MPLLADRFAGQQLVTRNKALAENHLNGIPIRVHRGQAHVPDMPEGFRYRYDGLYHFARYWQERGKDRFTIWRFRLQKASVAEYAAEVVDTRPSESIKAVLPGGNTAPSRRLSKITRVVRCSSVGDWLKQLHDFTCQICGTRLETPAGPYAETCHISRSVVPTTARVWQRASSASVPIVTSSLTSCHSGSMTSLVRGQGWFASRRFAAQHLK
jgi:predicted restriction endonuclease